MKQVIARISPITNTPVIFDVDSRNNGRMKAFMDGKDVEVGYDFYMSTEYLDPEQALKIARAYAKHVNIPEHEIMVRQRLPKTIKSHNVNAPAPVLVDTKEQPETLKELAQELHDKHTEESKKIAEKKPSTTPAKAKGVAKESTTKPSAPRQKKQDATPKEPPAATSDNPEGATVQRAKRRYEKKASKRSEAAMKRYLDDLQKTTKEMPGVFQPAVPGPNVTQEQVDQATLDLALALAKLLKNHKVL